ALTGKEVTGFAAAAAAYIKAGGDNRFMAPLIKHFGPTPLTDISQVVIDNAAAEIYPEATPATRNRQVYTPMVAVLRRAGIERRFKRPLGWKSPKGVSWLEPAQAFAVLAAADAIDAEFGLFLRLLCYTGMRLGEALSVRLAQVDLEGQKIYLLKTKNSDTRRVHLTPELVVALANHPRGLNREGRLIRFHASGHLRDMLTSAMEAAGVSFPPRQRGFHLFRHTWATWMRRYGGLDTSGLLETGAWRDRSSAARYEHLDATEEAQKANLLPVMKK
ncbi:MAG: tyrosine-type recombinase/integrase, partial [Xanthobacteraceae bacterium]